MVLKRGQQSIGAVTLVGCLAETFYKVQLTVQLTVGWHSAMHLNLPRRVLFGYFAHERRVMFENNVLDHMTAVTSILPVSKWSVLYGALLCRR